MGVDLGIWVASFDGSVHYLGVWKAKGGSLVVGRTILKVYGIFLSYIFNLSSKFFLLFWFYNNYYANSGNFLEKRHFDRFLIWIGSLRAGIEGEGKSNSYLNFPVGIWSPEWPTKRLRSSRPETLVYNTEYFICQNIIILFGHIYYILTQPYFLWWIINNWQLNHDSGIKLCILDW